MYLLYVELNEEYPKHMLYIYVKEFWCESCCSMYVSAGREPSSSWLLECFLNILESDKILKPSSRVKIDLIDGLKKPHKLSNT